MTLPGILTRLLRNQTELAAILADQQVNDPARRAALARACSENAADFQKFVAGYRLGVQKRLSLPRRCKPGS